MKIKIKVENGQQTIYKNGVVVGSFSTTLQKGNIGNTLKILLDIGSSSGVAITINTEQWEIEADVPSELEEALNHVCELQSPGHGH